jgi:site-specific recombinase XerD
LVFERYEIGLRRLHKIAQNFLQSNEAMAERRKKVTFQTLHHTYASMLIEKGVNLFHVKELLGHSSIPLTERSPHLSASTLKSAALKIQMD